MNLSRDNFHGQSMASSAIAAHEVGHAIQDAQDYAFLRFRSSLAPAAAKGSNISFFLLFAGIIFNMSEMLLLGIIFMSAAVLFQLVTLPVEFDASNRAMTQMISTGIIRNNEERETKKSPERRCHDICGRRACSCCRTGQIYLDLHLKQ